MSSKVRLKHFCLMVRLEIGCLIFYDMLITNFSFLICVFFRETCWYRAVIKLPLAASSSLYLARDCVWSRYISKDVYLVQWWCTEMLYVTYFGFNDMVPHTKKFYHTSEQHATHETNIPDMILSVFTRRLNLADFHMSKVCVRLYKSPRHSADRS